MSECSSDVSAVSGKVLLEAKSREQDGKLQSEVLLVAEEVPEAWLVVRNQELV